MDMIYLENKKDYCNFIEQAVKTAIESKRISEETEIRIDVEFRDYSGKTTREKKGPIDKMWDYIHSTGTPDELGRFRVCYIKDNIDFGLDVTNFKIRFFHIFHAKKNGWKPTQLKEGLSLCDHRRVANKLQSFSMSTDKAVFIGPITYKLSGVNSPYSSRRQIDLTVDGGGSGVWVKRIIMLGDVAIIDNFDRFTTVSEKIVCTPIKSSKIINVFESGFGEFNIPIPDFITKHPVVYAVTYNGYEGHNGVEPLFSYRDIGCTGEGEFFRMGDLDNLTIQEAAALYSEHPHCKHVGIDTHIGSRFLGYGEARIKSDEINNGNSEILVFDDHQVLVETHAELNPEYYVYSEGRSRSDALKTLYLIPIEAYKKLV